MIPILMPQVGENLTSGSVVEWRRQEGQPVTKGEVLLTVESEKAVFEVQAEVDGVLARILCQAGEEVAVLQPVGYIGQTAGIAEPPALLAVAQAEAVGGERHAAAVLRPTHGLVAPAAVRRPSSPAARRVARELGVELAGLEGSGPGGRIIKRDVLAAGADGARLAELPDQVVPFSRLRRHLAERTTLSIETVPHLYLFADIDMTGALGRCQRLQAQAGSTISVADMVIHAAARALRQFPRLNAHVDTERLLLKGAIHIGVASFGAEGMLLPVVPDADRRSLQEIAAMRLSHHAAARRGAVRLGPRATFTVLDLGRHDISRVLPLVNPPECAVLGTGAVQERVVSRHRMATVRDVLSVSLGCDHRAVDGEYAARFLERLKALLEVPETAAGPAGRDP